ncbi:hypothetical protein NDU88_007112 [Pleurodeles waltl]|uniref:Uncharacterized protein n=1 Tax=Pleurodeles waltl TaxID=8319 RepID=A0AAV7MFY0_PLEWA|nr:hypothetical protein NDU88_007112 [Pleurodeles waltl]
MLVLLATCVGQWYTTAPTDSAASDPEGEGPPTNPLRLPGPKGQGQQLRALSQIKDVTASKKSSDIGELEDPETAVRKTTRNQQPSPGAADFEEDAGPSTGESRAAPAAREAPNANSSHASGEAWPLQVRVAPGKGEGEGWV